MPAFWLGHGYIQLPGGSLSPGIVICVVHLH
jgi:hypothetical protein